MSLISLKTYEENLLLTKAYCALQLKNTNKTNAEILRSFNPKHYGQNIFLFKRVDFGERWDGHVSCFVTKWNIEILEREYLYEELFEEQLFHKKQYVLPVDPDIEHKGRILIAEIDLTVVDGASEVESRGVIDGIDWPPIDTWFYKTHNNNGRLLFAWIPEYFVELVQKGIDVNCMDCFYWSDERLETNF